MAYQNTGTIGPEDGDALISLKENHAPTADYIKRLRTGLPQKFPGTTFSFLPADIVSQILNFGLPAPIDIQIDRQQSKSQLRLRLQLAQTHPPCLRHRRSAHPAGVQLSADQRRRRSDVRWRRRTNATRHREQLAGHAFGQRPDPAEFLVEHPKTACLIRSSRRCRNIGSTRFRISSTCR